MVTTYDRSRDPRLRAGALDTPTTPSPRAGVAEYSTQRGQRATLSSHIGETEHGPHRGHSAQAPRRVASDSQSGIVQSLKSHDIEQDVEAQAPQAKASSASTTDPMRGAEPSPETSANKREDVSEPSLLEEDHMDVATEADAGQLAQQTSEREQSINAAYKKAGRPACTLPFDDGELCGGYHPEQLHDAAKAASARKTRQHIKTLQRLAPHLLKPDQTPEEKAAAKKQKLKEKRHKQADKRPAKRQAENEPTASNLSRPTRKKSYAQTVPQQPPQAVGGLTMEEKLARLIEATNTPEGLAMIGEMADVWANEAQAAPRRPQNIADVSKNPQGDR